MKIECFHVPGGAECKRLMLPLQTFSTRPSLLFSRNRIFHITTQPLRGEGEGRGVKGLTGVARKLRKLSTDTEHLLWRHLRGRQIEGFKFRRQQPVGNYVVDFVNLEKKVVIELDGGQHVLRPNDKIRDEWLRAEGYMVLRFWDNEVFSNLEGVLETIRDALLTPHPDPLPQG